MPDIQTNRTKSGEDSHKILFNNKVQNEHKN